MQPYQTSFCVKHIACVKQKMWLQQFAQRWHWSTLTRFNKFASVLHWNTNVHLCALQLSNRICNTHTHRLPSDGMTLLNNDNEKIVSQKMSETDSNKLKRIQPTWSEPHTPAHAWQEPRCTGAVAKIISVCVLPRKCDFPLQVNLCFVLGQSAKSGQANLCLQTASDLWTYRAHNWVHLHSQQHSWVDTNWSYRVFVPSVWRVRK